MKQNNKKSDEASRFLDNLTSFLTDDGTQQEDLAEDLRVSGLDPNGLKDEFRKLLSEHAPTWKEKAERERLAALETFSKAGTKAPRARNETVQEIQGLIQAMQQLGAPVAAGAYHQKFREATDADLESLLEDLAAQHRILKSKKTNE
jgi:hypothetical protein